MVRAAVFYILDEDSNGVGVGVFFSKSKAVTADHNLTASQVVGTQVVVQIPGNGFNVDKALSRCKQLVFLNVVRLSSSTMSVDSVLFCRAPRTIDNDCIRTKYRDGLRNSAIQHRSCVPSRVS